MNKIYFIKLIVILLTGCLSCNSLFKKNDAEFLPMDSVAVLVADCYFLEGQISVKHWECDVKEYSLTKYEELFTAHNITKEAFIKNVRYYVTSVEFAEIFMEKVDDIVEARARTLRDSIQ